MKNLLTTLWLSLVFVTLYAGGNNETSGARSTGIGGASVSAIDMWSVANNPGALGLIDKYNLGVAYESRYFLPEAAQKAATFNGPLGGGSMGVVAHSFGYAGYQDNRFGISYGRKLSEYLSLGVQLNYVQVNIGNGYGSRGAAVAELGMMIMPNDKITFGAHLYNPTRAKLADFDNERIPTNLSIGGNYKFSEKVRLLTEIEKGLDLPMNIMAGIEYAPIDRLFLRTGLSTLAGSFAFGLGYQWNNIVIDISNQWNQNLGFGATASIGYTFGKRK